MLTRLISCSEILHINSFSVHNENGCEQHQKIRNSHS